MTEPGGDPGLCDGSSPRTGRAGDRRVRPALARLCDRRRRDEHSGAGVPAEGADVWQPLPAWTEDLARDWPGPSDPARPASRICRVCVCRKPQKQTPFKLSYYMPLDLDPDGAAGRGCARVWSTRACAPVSSGASTRPPPSGCSTCCPNRRANIRPLRFLMARARHATRMQTVFAGDSGNDLDVLTSPDSVGAGRQRIDRGSRAGPTRRRRAGSERSSLLRARRRAGDERQLQRRHPGGRGAFSARSAGTDHAR